MEKDVEIWEEVKRTVKPLKGHKPVLFRKKTPVKPVAAKALPSLSSAPKSVVQLPAKQIKKLRTEKIPVEGTLDLHGMTAVRAHAALKNFLSRARRNGWRCVEIITGRGNPEKGTGVLKRELPLWLESEVGILHVESHPKSRGGSFLVMLRRVRG
jgi:DNA-nicking Smr family endonuclease